MLNFCTLFDQHYMSRGLTMYRSLVDTGADFHLYIFAFDQKSDEVLRKMELSRVTIISLKEFEDAELLKVKPERTPTEYCWTCTSSTILYCIQTFHLQNCTYVDADLYFYQSPQVLIEEKSPACHVIITSHRYTRYADQSKKSGKYCVQFMYFDNTPQSLEVLSWWRERCLEWCYNRLEDGKFGDQMYLDDWTTRFSCVWELQHPGGGLAPWNIQQYHFNQGLEGTEIETGKKFPAVFYHFHGIKFYANGKIIYKPNTYNLNLPVKAFFYRPYIEKLKAAAEEIKKTDATFDPNGTLPSYLYLKDKYIRGRWNYIKTNYIKRYLS